MAFIATNGLLTRGRMLNLSIPGCLLESTLQLRVGQPRPVEIEILEWKGPQDRPYGRPLDHRPKRAGLEFIRMSEDDQTSLRW
jgi:hypothetical protein